MKFKFAVFLAALLGLTLLSGCAFNQYESNYTGLDPRKTPAGTYQLCAQPTLRTGSLAEGELLNLADNSGYVLLGSSSFLYSNYNESHAFQYGKELGACLVWVDQRYSHTNSGTYSQAVVDGVETVTMRDGEGKITGSMTREIVRYQDVPYATPIYDFTAYFFAKRVDMPTGAVDLLTGSTINTEPGAQKTSSNVN